MRPDWVDIPLEGLLTLLDPQENRMSPTPCPILGRPLDDVEAILRGHHGDPFRVLGMFRAGSGVSSTSSRPTRRR
jgi:hypothetical protein